jgi:hypothetical protein
MVSRRAAVVVPALLAAIGGCRAIAGLHEITYAAPVDAGCPPLALPSAGDGRVRLVNAGTQGAAADFCVRPTGATTWGDPIFGGTRPECGAGLAYAHVTVPFATLASSIDVKAIAIGSTCAADATSEVDGVAVAAGGPVMTLVRMAGGSSAERLVALPESAAPAAGSFDRVRIVNALAGDVALDVGTASSAALPATITPVLPASIAPGGVPSSGTTTIGRVDAQGYLDMPPFPVAFGGAPAGETSALFVTLTSGVVDTQTLFAIGDAADDLHAPRALYCEDAPPVGDAASLEAPCALSELPTIAVDTFYAGLYGAAAVFEDSRRQPVMDAIAARGSDLMCILEVERQSDKDAITAAAKGHFPYAVMPTPPTTLDTAPDDPALADGGIPPPLAAPPCAGFDRTRVDAAYDCAAKYCSTTGDLSGVLTYSTACLPKNCLGPFGNIYGHGTSGDTCFDCMGLYFTAFETFDHGKTECLTDTRRPFAFDGQTTSLLLSRYPLVSTEVHILPSTGFRRAVLYAEVQLEDQSLDFYCAQLSSPNIDAELPYEGSYGQDSTTTLPDGGVVVENGWEDEQDLQVQRVIEYVRAKSGATGRPAIITGSWISSHTVTVDGGAVLTDHSPEVGAALSAAFTRADPPGYVPACDTCPAPTNVYGTTTSPTEYTATYLSGFPANATTEETLWATENSVTLVGNPYITVPAGGKGPLADVFPRLVRVIRPRPSK